MNQYCLLRRHFDVLGDVFKFLKNYCQGSVLNIICKMLSLEFQVGALECNLTGRCPFFKDLHNPFRKKICILIPCFGIFRL